MDKVQRRKILWRVPLVTLHLVFAFWGIWRLVVGKVPAVTQIEWEEGVFIQLPFAISRWSDVVFFPLFALFLSLLLTHERLRFGQDQKEDLFISGILGLLLGIFGCCFVLDLESELWILIPILVVIFVLSLILGLFVGLLIGVMASDGRPPWPFFASSVFFGSGFGLVFFISTSLVWGSVLGLFLGVFADLLLSLGFGLSLFGGRSIGRGILLFFSRQFWQQVKKWLLKKANWLLGKPESWE